MDSDNTDGDDVPEMIIRNNKRSDSPQGGLQNRTETLNHLQIQGQKTSTPLATRPYDGGSVSPKSGGQSPKKWLWTPHKFNPLTIYLITSFLISF